MIFAASMQDPSREFSISNLKTVRQGFTIVELLIVIVVIAILAAITVVAYGGIQRRAKDNARYAELSRLTDYLNCTARKTVITLLSI